MNETDDDGTMAALYVVVFATISVLIALLLYLI